MASQLIAIKALIIRNNGNEPLFDEMKKTSVDLTKLPIDERDNPDAIQQQFTAQVKKHFPEYLKS